MRGPEFRKTEHVRLLEIEGWQERRSVGLYFRAAAGRRSHFEELASEARRAADALAIGATAWNG